MKRLLAVLAAVCCLLFCLPAAGAVGEETPQDAQIENEDAVPSEGEPAEEAAPLEEDLTEAQTDAVDPLAEETHIRSLQISCTVDGGGKASVTQTVELSIIGALTEVRLAVPAAAKKAQAAGYKAKASTESGNRYLTISNEAGFTGTQTFTVSYTLSDLVTGTDEGQTFLLPLLAAQVYPISSMQFSVALPQTADAYPDFSSGYYGELIEDALNFTASSSVISGVTIEPLKDHETMSMTLSLPKGFFSGHYHEGLLSKVMTVILFVLLALDVFYWWRLLRNDPLRVQARTLPPDGVNPGDVPYLLSGGDADFNMLVSHWATLGYLSFYINKSGHVILRRRMSMGNERRLYERKLFDLLFGGETLCDGASLRYKKVGEKAMAVIPRYWARRLYSRDSGSPFLARLLSCLVCAAATLCAMDALAPDKLHVLFLLAALVAGFALCWLIHKACGAYYLSDWLWTGAGAGSALLLLILGGLGGATLVMVPAVALAVFIGWQTAHGGRRSDYGNEVIAQTLGFRRFLHNASDHHLMQMLRRDPQYFYKMLPYAEAMGRGKHFVALFSDIQLEPCQWYEAANSTPHTPASFYDHYCETMAMLNVSIRK